MKNLTRLLYQWHQKLGLFFGLAIIFWGLSGLAHPIISRLNPKPTVFMAPQLPLADLPSKLTIEPSILLKQQGIDSVTRARVFRAPVNNDELLLRIQVQQYDRPEYFSLTTGQKKDPEFDSQYAIALARHYTGEHKSDIVSVKMIHQFTDDYHYINRLLPVWQVQFDRSDGLRAYVDTDSGRLGTLSNHRKYVLGKTFRLLHSWTFIDNPKWRISLMSLCLIIGSLVSLAGLVLYFQYWRKGALKNSAKVAPSRRLHRGMGALISLAALSFSISGLWHTLHKWPIESGKTNFVATASENVNRHWQATINSDELNLNLANIFRQFEKPISNLYLGSVKGQSYWLAEEISTRSKPSTHKHHDKAQKDTNPAFHYFRTLNSAYDKELEKDHAITVASQLTSLSEATLREQILDYQVIRKFSGEYGFVNKRLPVIKLALQGQNEPTFYIETYSQTLASVVTNQDRYEGFSFAYLHKWHHLDFLGKAIRDSILAIFASMISLVFALGMYRYAVRKRVVNAKKNLSLDNATIN